VILLPAAGDRGGAVSWRMPDPWKAVRSRSSGDSMMIHSVNSGDPHPAADGKLTVICGGLPMCW
jgi:hypothetical protein